MEEGVLSEFSVEVCRRCRCPLTKAGGQPLQKYEYVNVTNGEGMVLHGKKPFEQEVYGQTGAESSKKTLFSDLLEFRF